MLDLTTIICCEFSLLEVLLICKLVDSSQQQDVVIKLFISDRLGFLTDVDNIII